MIKPILYSTLAISLFTACTAEDKSPSVYDDIQLELNDGKKWDVSDNMTVYMDSSFVLIDSHNSEDYSEIVEDLMNYKNKFVSNCDMPDKGHDILHAWLMPYIGLLDDLEKSNNKEEQNKIFEDIKNAQNVFNQYFE